MMKIEDLRVGDDIYVLSKKKTGIITGLKKKKNTDHYLVTVEFDDGEEITTSLDDADEPRYHVTPLGIMWLALCNVFGDEFLERPDSNEVSEKILNEFMEGMENSGFIRRTVDEKELKTKEETE